MNQLITLLIIFKNLICPCRLDRKVSDFKSGGGRYVIERYGKLPEEIVESSGLASNTQQTFWTHNDGGPVIKLYEIDPKGKLYSTWTLDGLVPVDLEEITKDDYGNIYLGDFGNNVNVRRNLRIYKINIHENNRIDTISFSYPDQVAFPPEKESMNFDCEAFFWYNNYLYLFSKNRGDKLMKVYKLQTKTGDQQAEIVQEIYINSTVTAAAIGSNKKEFVLLSYGKIYFFKIREDKFVPVLCKRFARSGQAEAIVYLNETDLLLSNEGRKLFLVRKRQARQ